VARKKLQKKNSRIFFLPPKKKGSLILHIFIFTLIMISFIEENINKKKEFFNALILIQRF
jgi:hypothetical protein